MGGKIYFNSLSTKQIFNTPWYVWCFLIYKSRPNFQKHDHVAIGFESEEWLVFSDPRRFGCKTYLKKNMSYHIGF